MSDSQMKDTMQVVLDRLEQSQGMIEQAAFDAINITDQLVRYIDELRTIMEKESVKQYFENCPDSSDIRKAVKHLLETSFRINNVAHQLESDADYQHETTETMKAMIAVLMM